MSSANELTLAASMTEALEAHRAKSKGHFYREQSSEHRKAEIAKAVNFSLGYITAADARCNDLKDTEDVRSRAIRYMECCATAGVFPSVQGLCVYALGRSRSLVYTFMKKNPDHPTTVLLEQLRDAFADLLVTGSLSGNLNAISAIFCLKNNHGFSDRLELEAVPAQEEKVSIDYEDLSKRYE